MAVGGWNFRHPPFCGAAVGGGPRRQKGGAGFGIVVREVRGCLGLQQLRDTAVLALWQPDPEIDTEWLADIFAQDCSKRTFRDTAHEFARDIAPGRPFPGNTQHVDDNAAATRLHARIDRAAHVDVAEYFQVPRLTPPFLVDRLQVAGRNGPGIIHQNVDVMTGSR
mgnify:CR=1 FL=1